MNNDTNNTQPSMYAPYAPTSYSLVGIDLDTVSEPPPSPEDMLNKYDGAWYARGKLWDTTDRFEYETPEDYLSALNKCERRASK